MDMNHGIAVEATVTVDGDCDMSCEVLDDQIQLIFGRIATGLHVYFDWPALDKLLAVLRAAMRRVEMTPAGTPACFTVSADANSRQAHTPSQHHDDANELLVSDVEGRAGPYAHVRPRYNEYHSTL